MNLKQFVSCIVAFLWVFFFACQVSPVSVDTYNVQERIKLSEG